MNRRPKKNRLLKKIIDRMFPSVLEQDFGDSDPNALTLPTASVNYTDRIENAQKNVRAIFRMITGLTMEQGEKICERLKQLPKDKTARFCYQTNLYDEAAELQITIVKVKWDKVQIHFCSSPQVVALIQQHLKI